MSCVLGKKKKKHERTTLKFQHVTFGCHFSRFKCRKGNFINRFKRPWVTRRWGVEVISNVVDTLLELLVVMKKTQ